MIRLVE